MFIVLFVLSAQDTLRVYQLPEMVVQASSLAWEDTLCLDRQGVIRFMPLGLLDHGDMATLSLDGLSSRHTRITVDGIPLNSPATGTFDLRTLFWPGFSSALVSRGGKPWIEISSDKTTRLGLRLGSFGAKGVNAGLFGQKGGVAAFFSRAENNFDFKDEFGRPETRQNADQRISGALAQLEMGPARFGALVNLCQRGVPGSVGFPTPTARLWDSLIGLSLFVKGQFFYTTREITVFKQQGIDNTVNALAAGGYGSFGPMMWELRRGHALDLWVNQGLVAWTVGFGTCRAKIGASWFKKPMPELEMTAGLDKFSLGAFVSASPPAINDLAWPEDPFARGNPDLKPELLTGIKAGFSLAGFKAWAWWNRVHDYIAWVSGQQWQPLNLDPVDAPGLSFDLLLGHMRTGASYTPTRWQGKRLAGLADIKAWAGLSGSGFWTSAVFYSDRPATVGGARTLDAFALFDAGFEAQKANWFFGVSVFNLFDQTPQLLSGYPLPGRRLELSLTKRF